MKILGKFEFDLNSYFIHRKLLISIVDEIGAKNLKQAIVVATTVNDLERGLFLEKAFIDEAIRLIVTRKIRPLEEVILADELKEGMLVTTDRKLLFKGLSKALTDKEKGILTYAEFHTILPELNDMEILGRYNPEHLTCCSAGARLTRQAHVFVLAHVDEIHEKKVILRPILIGDKLISENPSNFIQVPQPLLVMPEKIDEFKKMAPYGKYDIKENKQYSEKLIKNWFAEIIHEGNVPKDWGGEVSDLFTTHLHLNGQRVRAAFIFKGPAKFHPMTLSDLGKNGDQINRLFKEPVELCILQHCHFIDRSVWEIMEAFASRSYSPKYYCVIDGVDTLRILKGLGKI